MESWHPDGDTNALHFSSVTIWSSVVFHAFSIQAALKYSLVFLDFDRETKAKAINKN